MRKQTKIRQSRKLIKKKRTTDEEGEDWSNEIKEDIDPYLLKLYQNIGTYTIFEFQKVHIDDMNARYPIWMIVFLGSRVAPAASL